MTIYAQGDSGKQEKQILKAHCHSRIEPDIVFHDRSYLGHSNLFNSSLWCENIEWKQVAQWFLFSCLGLSNLSCSWDTQKYVYLDIDYKKDDISDANVIEQINPTDLL